MIEARSRDDLDRSGSCFPNWVNQLSLDGSIVTVKKLRSVEAISRLSFDGNQQPPSLLGDR